ncbi:hypothetical protein B0J11DRAFT_220113 [Dendryphion nanum]|uniref:Secreted protein n=1 Tax=Dendryphion nanum TaxID=256645 RepID=A0A9P9E7S0_9PLEO|nr:hypothetical protein B0J11DRAFT_220113 [Dendryphion nanum]
MAVVVVVAGLIGVGKAVQAHHTNKGRRKKHSYRRGTYVSAVFLKESAQGQQSIPSFCQHLVARVAGDDGRCRQRFQFRLLRGSTASKPPRTGHKTTVSSKRARSTMGSRGNEAATSERRTVRERGNREAVSGGWVAAAE